MPFSWREFICCCPRSRVEQDPNSMPSKDGTPEESQEAIDSDTLHRKFMAAVEKLQKNNATLLHENEKLKTEIRTLKESADKEALLGRGSLRENHGIYVIYCSCVDNTY